MIRESATLIPAGAVAVFSTGHIALMAAITGLLGLVIVSWRLRPLSIGETLGETLLIALLVAASVFVWRLSANLPQLNSDGVPGFSANDWLCPVITYVCLGVYAAVHPPADPVRWGQVRALLTSATLIVNVVTI